MQFLNPVAHGYESPVNFIRKTNKDVHVPFQVGVVKKQNVSHVSNPCSVLRCMIVRRLPARWVVCALSAVRKNILTSSMTFFSMYVFVLIFDIKFEYIWGFVARFTNHSIWHSFLSDIFWPSTSHSAITLGNFARIAQAFLIKIFLKMFSDMFKRQSTWHSICVCAWHMYDQTSYLAFYLAFPIAYVW